MLLLPSFTFASFDKNLKYGSNGMAVREMQNFLIKDGCLTASSTGRYLTNTYFAVKCFQTKKGLPVTGYFGPLTRIKANAVKSQTAIVSNAIPSSTLPSTSTVSVQKETLEKVSGSSDVGTVAQPSASPVETGNGCLNKKKGDACSFGAAPNGVCDNALNGDLLFCIPKHAQ